MELIFEAKGFILVLFIMFVFQPNQIITRV